MNRVIIGLLALAVVRGVRRRGDCRAAPAEAGPTFKAVGKWGKVGKGNGQFGANAYGLATDKAGNVYVADTDNFRIQVFSSKGAFKRKHAFVTGEERERRRSRSGRRRAGHGPADGRGAEVRWLCGDHQDAEAGARRRRRCGGERLRRDRR